MVELGGWFKKEFWSGAGADGRINTKLITKKLESYLPADPGGVRLEGGLLRGWNVETRGPLARIPLLYGENGKPLYGVNPDAVYAADDGYRALLEIEGGGAVQNNRLGLLADASVLARTRVNETETETNVPPHRQHAFQQC